MNARSSNLPQDVSNLVINYLIKPTYILDKEIRNIPEFSNLSDLENLTKTQALLALRNPGWVTPRNWARISRRIIHLMGPDKIIEHLAFNHSEHAIKIITSANNWKDIIFNSSTDGYILDHILLNPHATPLIDELYKIIPEYFRHLNYKIYEYESTINIINKFSSLTQKSLIKRYIMHNQSTKILGRYINLFSSEDLVDLLENTTTLAIQYCKQFMSKYLDNPLNYSYMDPGEKLELDMIVRKLAGNSNPMASQILEQILNNSKDKDGTISDVLLKKIFDHSLTYYNQSDYILDLITMHIHDPDNGPIIRKEIDQLIQNHNPKAIEILNKYYHESLESLSDVLCSNPGAIEYIKSHPEQFTGPNHDGLYSNPGIFTKVSDTKLIKKLVCMF